MQGSIVGTSNNHTVLRPSVGHVAEDAVVNSRSSQRELATFADHSVFVADSNRHNRIRMDIHSNLSIANARGSGLLNDYLEGRGGI